MEVIDVIHKTMTAKWRREERLELEFDQLWNEYVPKHLLPRLYGFELMMAPYAVAHMKIGLKLYETGYRFGSDERVHVYLTNSLEPPSKLAEQTAANLFEALGHEAQAVNAIKSKKRFTVVIGNPPYSVSSQNAGEWILTLLDLYKKAVRNERNIQPLSDDYIKFVRLCHWLVENTMVGIMGLITNNSYLSGTIHKGMRKELAGCFPLQFFLDLHGSQRVADKCLDGKIDDNVFDIQQGVAITLAVKKPSGSHPAKRYSELYGKRDTKIHFLLEASINKTDWHPLTPAAPDFYFRPVNNDGAADYMKWASLADVFTLYSSGIQTKRDGLFIDIDRYELVRRMELLLSGNLKKEFIQEYGIRDSSGYNFLAKIGKSKFNEDKVQPILYRPFDIRWVYYDEKLLGRAFFKLMKNFLRKKNIGLTVLRFIRKQRSDYFGITNQLTDMHFLDLSADAMFIFPLYRYADKTELKLASNVSDNFSPFLWDSMRRLLDDCVTPHQIFAYMCAVFFSPSYREKYFEFLKVDFPRLPLPGNVELFRELVRLGGELADLHLMKSSKLDHFITTYTGPKNPEVERVGWSDGTVWLDAAATKKGQPATLGTIGFHGVPEAVWNFHIGGYQVCEKWLKDRKGRTLSADDIAHYHRIVIALHETIRLMKEIDEVIEAHGGWPGAFVTSKLAAVAKPAGGEDTESTPDNVVLLRPAAAPAPEEYELERPPLRKAAEPPSPTYGEQLQDRQKVGDTPTSRNREDLDREDIICCVRQVFADGVERERDTAVGELARGLGYQRTGNRIAEELDNALRTAVRRGILDNSGATLKLAAPSIEQYERGFLKDQFFASLCGRQWIERDEAIRGFARWLGFRRTGSSIDDTARSLINGLIREGRIEGDGSLIRRAL